MPWERALSLFRSDVKLVRRALLSGVYLITSALFVSFVMILFFVDPFMLLDTR